MEETRHLQGVYFLNLHRVVETGLVNEEAWFPKQDIHLARPPGWMDSVRWTVLLQFLRLKVLGMNG